MELQIESGRTWRDACDDEATAILDRVGISGPPVDAFDVADRLGIDVAVDAGQGGRGRIGRLAGRVSIFLQPDDRPERMQWTVAHEIGEARAHRVFQRMGGAPADAPAALREQVANQMASSLLLPLCWFTDDAAAVDCDLFTLKEQYRTASHELILMNLLRLPSLAIATVFDNGRLTRRRSNGQLAPPRLIPAESVARDRAHETNRALNVRRDGLRVQVWPVHEPGWERELLRTTPLEDFDEAAD